MNYGGAEGQNHLGSSGGSSDVEVEGGMLSCFWMIWRWLEDDEATMVKLVEKDVNLHAQAENRVDPLLPPGNKKHTILHGWIKNEVLLQWKGVQAAAGGWIKNGGLISFICV
jgi:hypothetical protein